ncbi:ALF repeat-containing protein, partial [Streptomyces sp. NPDC058470]|uniref:ALF repeat-containing protein n=1 Tax=Streptomyces sp. NPDC058470 TaxID=3346515 RepID=UPI00366821BA
MRLTRAALVVAAGALAPALLLSTPSFATATASASAPVTMSVATEPTDEDNTVAIATILADPATGKAVRREAGKALDGTAADRTYFLETGRWIAQDEDNTVAIATILADPATGKAVRREAGKALDGTA